MAEDTYTEVTNQGWFSRLRGAFKGIVFGMLAVLLASWLLFWNEGRAVKRYKTLNEGGGAVVSVTSDRVDAAYEGKLVHTSGLADTTEILADRDFAVSATAIHLKREVQMYQWRQREDSKTKKKLGGGTETVTTYSYQKEWSDQRIDSSSFKKPEGHQNPGALPFPSRTLSATDVTLGAFQLSPGLISSMSNYQSLRVSSIDLLADHLRQKAKLHNGGVYLGGNPASPEVGDMKVTFQYVEPASISVVAAQQGGTLGPFKASTGGTILLLTSGLAPAEAMFETAHEANKMTTWIFRVLGFLLIWFGLKTIFRPLSVMADVVPAFGNLVGAGTGSVAFMLAAFIALCVAATAWFFYRPWLAILLIAIAVGLVVLIWRAFKKSGKNRAAMPPPVQPPPPAVPPPPPVPS